MSNSSARTIASLPKQIGGDWFPPAASRSAHRGRHVGESLISDCYYSGMTKNLGNAERSAPKQPASSSALSRLAPALFPLAVVALGYLIGWQFFGF
jgi:hypothetical protein